MSNTTPAVATLDPLQVASENYKLLMENDSVRVFDIRIPPGESIAMHAVGPSVIYVFNDGRLRHTYADGKVEEKIAKAGAVVWDEAETHETKNVGDTDIHSLKIELKEK
jgi:quercetin dioxygenase-like cupin family protein